jgi:hypothetical protein
MPADIIGTYVSTNFAIDPHTISKADIARNLAAFSDQALDGGLLLLVEHRAPFLIFTA